MIVLAEESLTRPGFLQTFPAHQLYDIAWQSVPYGLYSTKPKGRSPEGEGYISCTARDRHAVCIIYRSCVRALRGSNKQSVIEQTMRPVNGCPNVSR